jgi:hypothetical protein
LPGVQNLQPPLEPFRTRNIPRHAWKRRMNR